MSTPITEQDKAALLALVTRYTRAQVENEALFKKLAEIQAQVLEGRAKIQKMIAAFSIFGFDVNKKPEDGSGFQEIRALVGSEAYLAAYTAGGRDASQTSTRDPSEGMAAVQPELSLADEAGTATIREMAMNQLRQAGAQGTTAADIRRHIESARGTKLHFKTVGMTLYRLTQDGFARREGRTWFAVPQSAEKANPGG